MAHDPQLDELGPVERLELHALRTVADELEHLVTAGYLGRKTKRGFRDYSTR